MEKILWSGKLRRTKKGQVQLLGDNNKTYTKQIEDLYKEDESGKTYRLVRSEKALYLNEPAVAVEVPTDKPAAVEVPTDKPAAVVEDNIIVEPNNTICEPLSTTDNSANSETMKKSIIAEDSTAPPPQRLYKLLLVWILKFQK